MTITTRSWKDYFVDTGFGWWCGLPWPSCSYTIQSVRIPVGQDIHLAANLYQPTIEKPLGTILIRTSYGIGSLPALGNARLFAARGFQVLLAACRGTDPSDGQELIPAVNEADDGLATIEWMRHQSWYTGSFGLYGGSYLGYTQWAILSNPPPDAKAAVIGTGPHDFGDFIWGTGAMQAHLIDWADLMTAAKRGKQPGPEYIKTQPQNLVPIYNGVPMIDAINTHFKDTAPSWLNLCAEDSTLSTPLVQRMNQSAALERANLPILQFTGWNDVMLPTITHQHQELSKRNRPVRMVIGPWSHLGSQYGSRIAEGFEFLKQNLCRQNNLRATKSAGSTRVFVTGLKQWRDYPSWPPPQSTLHELYLGPDQCLLSNLLGSDCKSSTFQFNPSDPTPCIGMPRPFDDLTPASYDDTTLANRSDVLIFTTTPLKAEIEIIGRPSMEIFHSSDNPHVDLLVRISEVDPKGKSIRIADVYRRLDPNRDMDIPIKLNLSDCAHRFVKGTRIRVIIAGSAHPAYIRNLGTGESSLTGNTTKPAIHTVHHSKQLPSKIILPISG